jgi:predicted dehydrogenase
VTGAQLEAKIGIIGYKNHAYRVISILEKFQDCNVKFIYHPTKNLTDNRFTNDFSKLLTCDAIIIASPNYTHFEYLKKLVSTYNGYILCEKPPVTSMEQIDFLNSLSKKDKSRIYFNFNYRFSNLAKVLKSYMNSEQIGKIISINIISTHGLAFKNDYENSWRADGQKNKHTILETVSIHYVDLFSSIFGKINQAKYFPNLVSERGSSFDTSNLLIKYSNGVSLSIFNSYATPYLEDFLILGTNGYIRILDNELKIYSPRDTYDDNGFFINPPIYKKQAFSIISDYENSLIESLKFFINKINKHDNFLNEDFDHSLLSNKIILELEEQN